MQNSLTAAGRLHQGCCPACDSERVEYEFTVDGSHILRCVDCSMLFSREVPLASAVRAGELAQRLRDRIAHLIANVPAIDHPVLAVVPDGVQLDISGVDVMAASQVIDRRLPRAPYGAAVCVDVLDRVDNAASLLNCLRAALKPDAPFSVTVRSIDSTAARHAGPSWRGFRQGACRFYGVDSLQNTLVRHGFRHGLTYVDGAVRQQSLRLRSAARIAGAVGLAGAAIRAQGRANFIDESLTIISLRQHPIERYRLSVIVPVFNERRTFRELMTRLLAKSIDDVDIEVIIVESNSTDGSRSEVLDFRSHPRVKVVLQDRPRGKGNAVRAGLARATGDIILFQDADLEYEIEDYDDLLRPITAYQRNFVIGSRHTTTGSAWKIRDFNGAPVLSQFFNVGHAIFLGLLNGLYAQSLADPFSMFKVFRSDCIAGLVLECDRFDFDFEIVIKLLRKGYRPLETPVNYHSRSIAEGKKVTLVRDPLTWIRALLRFRAIPLYPPPASRAQERQPLPPLGPG
jgi:hypothetical protein